MQNIKFTSLKRCMDLLQILCGCFSDGPLTRLLKSGCHSYFLWNYEKVYAILKQFFKRNRLP